MSVIIPHLNEPDDLSQCLRALVAQRQEGVRFEIIVVDNGSRQMPDAECAGIANLRLVRESVPGPGPARNLGASLAHSDLLVFVDADCVVQPGWALAIVKAMDAHPHLGFIGGDIRIKPANPQRHSAIECYECVYAYNARAYVEHHGFAATGNMAVRRHVFQSVGPFGGIGTMEDTDWGKRAIRQGYKCMFLAEAKVLTPSCKSFAELARRWDRHVAHEFRNLGDIRVMRLVGWVLKAVAIAASPTLEGLRLVTTDRIDGSRDRVLAWLCLARVRAYRAKRMLSVALEGNGSRFVEQWNRNEP